MVEQADTCRAPSQALGRRTLITRPNRHHDPKNRTVSAPGATGSGLGVPAVFILLERKQHQPESSGMLSVIANGSCSLVADFKRSHTACSACMSHVLPGLRSTCSRLLLVRSGGRCVSVLLAICSSRERRPQIVDVIDAGRHPFAQKDVAVGSSFELSRSPRMNHDARGVVECGKAKPVSLPPTVANFMHGRRNGQQLLELLSGHKTP